MSAHYPDEDDRSAGEGDELPGAGRLPGPGGQVREGQGSGVWPDRS